MNNQIEEIELLGCREEAKDIMQAVIRLEETNYEIGHFDGRKEDAPDSLLRSREAWRDSLTALLSRTPSISYDAAAEKVRLGLERAFLDWKPETRQIYPNDPGYVAISWWPKHEYLAKAALAAIGIMEEK